MIRERRESKMKQVQAKPEKIPNQYPSTSNRESIANLVSPLVDMDMQDVDDDTDEDMLSSSVFMARIYNVTNNFNRVLSIGDFIF